MAGILYTDNSRATDANGNPLAGALLYFYLSGGTTPTSVYQDAALSTAHANPVVADAGGRFPVIYLDNTVTYRAILKTAAGVLVPGGDVDPYTAGGLPNSSTTIATMKAIPKARLANGQVITATGYSAFNDGGGGDFYWHSTSTATVDNGLVFASNQGGAGRWIRIFKGAIDPTWFGAKGDNATDDTSAMQAAFDDTVNLAVRVPYGKYRVEHVDLDLIGRIFDGEGALIVGNSSSQQTSLVGMRGGLSYYNNLRVVVGFSLNYQCGIHWYTNRLDIGDRYYPGYLDGVSWQVEGAEIGLMIGALPSQSVIQDQSYIGADGEAIDAPLSEGCITGYKATNCVIACYMRQPNGKVCLIGPRLLSEIGLWSGYATPQKSASVVVSNDGSELMVIGGEMTHIQGGANGTLFTVTGGRLNIVGTVIETTVPSYIDGHSYVFLDHVQNFGLNYVDRAFVEIGPTFDGTLSIANTRVTRPKRTAELYNCDLIRSVSAIGGSYLPSPQTIVNFENTEFRDCPWRVGGSVYQPLVRGIRASFVQCQLTAYDEDSERVFLQRIDDGPDLLRGVVDRTYKTIAAYGQTSTTADGGFSFAASGSGSQWGIETTGLPDVEDIDFYAWIRLTAGATGTTTAETAKFSCKPSKAHIVRGFIKTGATTATLKIIAKHWDYDGSAAATASTELFNGQELQFGATIQPVMFYFVPPADADKSSLYIEVQNGADCRITLLEVN